MGLLVTCSFVNSTNAAEYDFLTPGCRVKKFAPSRSTRIEKRPKMQAPGDHPVVPARDALAIHQEGLLLASSEEFLIIERDALLLALDGDLTIPSTLTEDGVLTIEYAGWGETASASVMVESSEAELNPDGGGKSLPYMVAWIIPTPYFVGDSSGLPRYP